MAIVLFFYLFFPLLLAAFVKCSYERQPQLVKVLWDRIDPLNHLITSQQPDNGKLAVCFLLMTDFLVKYWVLF